VAFFYFDQQQADRYSRITALQSIAAQLLHSQRNNKSFIDIASVMMRDDGQGQILASEKVLQSLIHIYVEQLDSSYLVFDGLDECAEWDEFLISLRKCTESTSSKIIILSRPHLPVSAIIGQKPFQLNLGGERNLNDIEACIRPRIRSLIAAGKLGRRYTIERAEQVVQSLARRADSIFLWASLMMQYLESPTVTPKEREEVVDDLKSFRGLEDLFAKILEDLRKRVPPTQHSKVHKIFEWLVTAQQPWTVEILEMALAVQPDRPATPEDFVEDFELALLQLCGPLVEVRQDGVVRFIHLSVAEYLTSPVDLSTRSSLSVQLHHAHCSMATLLLSYIMNEIPKEPLGGNASTRPDPCSLSRRYCLLRYAATCWSKHAYQSLDISLEDNTHLRILAQKAYKDLFLLLSKGIADKHLITVWIEASWAFEAPPTVLELALQISRTADAIPLDVKKTLEPLASTLERLSKNLSHLNKYWCDVLAANPNEIWLPSTNAFTDCEFWVGTDAAKVNWLSCPEEGESILIVSKESRDGSEVGIIRVWPSELVLLFRDVISPNHAR
jgi:hypothetical protein